MPDDKIEFASSVVGTLKQDVSVLKTRVDTFDKNLDKLTDISLNVSKLLAVHEQRIEASEKVNRALPNIIEKHREEAQQSATRVNDRAVKVESDLRVEITKSQREILDEIKAVNNGMHNIRADVVSTAAGIKIDLENQIDAKEIFMNAKLAMLDDRLSSMQKIIWIVTGAATVAGAIISQLSGLLHISVGA